MVRYAGVSGLVDIRNLGERIAYDSGFLIREGLAYNRGRGSVVGRLGLQPGPIGVNVQRGEGVLPGIWISAMVDGGVHVCGPCALTQRSGE